MQIIFNFNENNPAAKIAIIKGGRLLVAAVVVVVVLAFAVRLTAVRIAENWVDSNDAIITDIMDARIEDKWSGVWEKDVDALRDNIADMQAQIITLRRRGGEIADYLNLPGDEIFAAVETDRCRAASPPLGIFHDMSMATLSRQQAALAATAKQYDVLRDRAVKGAVMKNTLPIKRPVQGRNWIASGYGYRKDPFTGRRAFHSGVDYAAARGTPVIAAASGLVIYSGRLGNYGNAVQIRHGDDISTLYGHLSKINVSLWEYVEFGDVIGAVGSTGRSTGPHLHYEIRINNRPRSVNKTLRELQRQRDVEFNT